MILKSIFKGIVYKPEKMLNLTIKVLRGIFFKKSWKCEKIVIDNQRISLKTFKFNFFSKR